MYFAINIVLAVIWTGLLGGFSLENIISGYLAGYLMLWVVTREHQGHDNYFGKLPRLAGFLVYYLWDLVKSNAVIAYDVLTPTDYMKPGVIGIPLEAETDLEITVLANLITMTPGTLSLDISPDRKTLYVHAMYINDPDVLRAEIKENLEHRVLELMR